MEVSRELLDWSLDALDDVFYIYDADGQLVYWNQCLNDLFGLEDDELVGMSPSEFFLEADRGAVEAAVAEVFETGEVVTEARAETTKGEIRFQLTGHLLENDGEIVGFSGMARDVTEKHERERRLAQQNARLDEFVSVVSHDLRNPIGVLSGSLDLARETADPSHLERGEHALQKMETLIDDLLTLARKGAWVEQLHPVALDEIVDQTWAEVATGEATLSVLTDATVMADADRLKQLLGNLYRNAIQHGRHDVTVTVGDLADGFFVADDGPGIPASMRESVFESGFTSTPDGIGLGLSIVTHIARAHGWTVSATESADGGVRFEIHGVERR